MADDQLSTEDLLRLQLAAERAAHASALADLAIARASASLRSEQDRIRVAYGTKDGDNINIDTGRITRGASNG